MLRTWLNSHTASKSIARDSLGSLNPDRRGNDQSAVFGGRPDVSGEVRDAWLGVSCLPPLTFPAANYEAKKTPCIREDLPWLTFLIMVTAGTLAL